MSNFSIFIVLFEFISILVSFSNGIICVLSAISPSFTNISIDDLSANTFSLSLLFSIDKGASLSSFSFEFALFLDSVIFLVDLSYFIIISLDKALFIVIVIFSASVMSNSEFI